MAAKHGEPPRTTVPQQGSKPIQAVTDDDGAPVLDGQYFLAWHKATGTFYIGRTAPRVYLRTRDRLQAIYRFREWTKRAAPLAYVTVEHAPHRHAEISQPLRVVDTLDPDRRESVIYSVPSADFWREVRERALTDPETFQRETGLRIIDEKPQPSATLATILETYLARRKLPCAEEIKKVHIYWDFFVKYVAVPTVRDIDAAALDKWEAAAFQLHDKGGSPATLQHRFDYPSRLLRYAIRKMVDADECERVRKEILKRRIELPDQRNPNPEPISPADFAKLLAHADTKWKAILLTGLNLCYYGVDLRTLPREGAIDFRNGWVIFDRAKTGQTTRVGVLWARTLDAIKKYRKEQPHAAATLFISQYRTPYTAQGLRMTFRLLRERAGVPHVDLCHLRDGGYTAAVQGGAGETHAKILAGHRIGGMSDAYIKSNPLMVKDACDAIEKIYFPPTPTPTKKGKGR